MCTHMYGKYPHADTCTLYAKYTHISAHLCRHIMLTYVNTDVYQVCKYAPISKHTCMPSMLTYTSAYISAHTHIRTMVKYIHTHIHVRYDHKYNFFSFL